MMCTTFDGIATANERAEAKVLASVSWLAKLVLDALALTLA